MKMKAIKWINKFSGESGYVESLADSHFINTWEIENAAKFRSQKEADKVLDTLYEFGEDANNDFEVVELPKAEKKAATTKKAAAKPAAKTAKAKAEKAAEDKKPADEKKPAAKKTVAKKTTAKAETKTATPKASAAKKTAKA